MTRTHAEDAALACSEAFERIVRGELFFAGRWSRIAEDAEDCVLEKGVAAQLHAVREAVEALAVECQRSAASRRCAQCTKPLSFGDHHMCPGCRVAIIDQVLGSELWCRVRAEAAASLRVVRERLVASAARRHERAGKRR